MLHQLEDACILKGIEWNARMGYILPNSKVESCVNVVMVQFGPLHAKYM